MEYKAQELFFALLRYELFGREPDDEQKAQITPEMSHDIYNLSRQHDLTHLAASALLRLKLVDEDSPQGREFSKHLMLAVYRTEGFAYELSRISQVLEDEKIPFILLKGSVIRDIYPQSWMRTSCDMDVLVHYEDMDRAVAALERENQYTLVCRSGHDVSLRAPGGWTLELHFDLIEEEGVTARAAEEILDNVWQRAVPRREGSFCQVLSDEMEYFYHIAHMLKHFELGGCGVRPFIDLYLLNKMSCSAEKRQALLQQGGILQFARGVSRLSEVWMEDGKHDELTRELEEFILQGGVFGNSQNRVSVMQQQTGGRLSYLRSRLFLPMSVLREKFPVLKKYPCLAPVCQVVRWLRTIKEGRGNRAVREIGQNMSINKADTDKGAALRQKLGL